MIQPSSKMLLLYSRVLLVVLALTSVRGWLPPLQDAWMMVRQGAQSFDRDAYDRQLAEQGEAGYVLARYLRDQEAAGHKVAILASDDYLQTYHFRTVFYLWPARVRCLRADADGQELIDLWQSSDVIGVESASDLERLQQVLGKPLGFKPGEQTVVGPLVFYSKPEPQR